MGIPFYGIPWIYTAGKSWHVQLCVQLYFPLKNTKEENSVPLNPCCAEWVDPITLFLNSGALGETYNRMNHGILQKYSFRMCNGFEPRYLFQISFSEGFNDKFVYQNCLIKMNLSSKNQAWPPPLLMFLYCSVPSKIVPSGPEWLCKL